MLEAESRLDQTMLTLFDLAIERRRPEVLAAKGNRAVVHDRLRRGIDARDRLGFAGIGLDGVRRNAEPVDGQPGPPELLHQLPEERADGVLGVNAPARSDAEHIGIGLHAPLGPVGAVARHRDPCLLRVLGGQTEQCGFRHYADRTLGDCFLYAGRQRCGTGLVVDDQRDKLVAVDATLGILRLERCFERPRRRRRLASRQVRSLR